jgi:hypothetical protein
MDWTGRHGTLDKVLIHPTICFMPCSAFGETQQRTKTSATCYYFLCVFLIIYASTGPPGCESYYARHWRGAGSAAVLLSKSQAKQGPKSGCMQQEVLPFNTELSAPFSQKVLASSTASSTVERSEKGGASIPSPAVFLSTDGL